MMARVVGIEKRDYLPEMFSVDEMDCLRRIRAAFDPLGIANPGKMFPVAGAPALDEPTTGLDPRSRKEVQELVRTLRELNDTTILLCTHDRPGCGDADASAAVFSAARGHIR